MNLVERIDEALLTTADGFVAAVRDVGGPDQWRLAILALDASVGFMTGSALVDLLRGSSLPTLAWDVLLIAVYWKVREEDGAEIRRLSSSALGAASSRIGDAPRRTTQLAIIAAISFIGLSAHLLTAAPILAFSLFCASIAMADASMYLRAAEPPPPPFTRGRLSSGSA